MALGSIRQQMRASQAVIDTTCDRLLWATLALIVASLLLGGLLAWFLTRSVSRPLAEVLAAAENTRHALDLHARGRHHPEFLGRGQPPWRGTIYFGDKGNHGYLIY